MQFLAFSGSELVKPDGFFKALKNARKKWNISWFLTSENNYFVCELPDVTRQTTRRCIRLEMKPLLKSSSQIIFLIKFARGDGCVSSFSPIYFNYNNNNFTRTKPYTIVIKKNKLTKI